MPDPAPVPDIPRPLDGLKKALGLLLAGVVSAVVSAVVASAVGHAPAPADSSGSPSALTAKITVTPPDGTEATGSIPVGTPATVLVEDGYRVTIGGEPTPGPGPGPNPDPTPAPTPVTGHLWAVLVWDATRDMETFASLSPDASLRTSLHALDCYFSAVERSEKSRWASAAPSTPCVLFVGEDAQVHGSPLTGPGLTPDRIVSAAKALRGNP